MSIYKENDYIKCPHCHSSYEDEGVTAIEFCVTGIKRGQECVTECVFCYEEFSAIHLETTDSVMIFVNS